MRRPPHRRRASPVPICCCPAEPPAPSTIRRLGSIRTPSPRLDRAVAVVGLFETGTTDCARRLAIVPGSVSSGRSLAVGCVGAMAPGWRTPVLKRLDGNAGAIEHLFGDDATAARTLLGGGGINEADVRRVSRAARGDPEFWIAYQDSVLDAYAQATALAQTAGFVSERGRLLVFDRMANSGVGSVNRAIARYAEAPSRTTHPTGRQTRRPPQGIRRHLQGPASAIGLRQHHQCPHRHYRERQRLGARHQLLARPARRPRDAVGGCSARRKRVWRSVPILASPRRRTATHAGRRRRRRCREPPSLT